MDNLEKNNKITSLLFCPQKGWKNIKKYLKNMLTNKIKDGTIKNVPHQKDEERKEHIEK